MSEKAKAEPAKEGPAKKAKPDKETADPSSATASDAIALLRQDHRDVEQLFAQFEAAKGAHEQRALALAICGALKIHALLEETLFYPAAYEATGEADLLQEALVEHASAKDLIAQIETGAPGEPMFAARVRVLSEYVRHHVAEEEGELFPLCKRKLDTAALGERIRLRKLELLPGVITTGPVPVG